MLWPFALMKKVFCFDKSSDTLWMVAKSYTKRCWNMLKPNNGMFTTVFNWWISHPSTVSYHLWWHPLLVWSRKQGRAKDNGTVALAGRDARHFMPQIPVLLVARLVVGVGWGDSMCFADWKGASNYEPTGRKAWNSMSVSVRTVECLFGDVFWARRCLCLQHFTTKKEQ